METILKMIGISIGAILLLLIITTWVVIWYEYWLCAKEEKEMEKKEKLRIEKDDKEREKWRKVNMKDREKRIKHRESQEVWRIKSNRIKSFIKDYNTKNPKDKISKKLENEIGALTVRMDKERREINEEKEEWKKQKTTN